MSKVGQKERETQDRIVRLFRDQLGYHYLDNWEERPDNSNGERPLAGVWLSKKYDENTIKKALYELDRAKGLHGGRTLTARRGTSFSRFSLLRNW